MIPVNQPLIAKNALSYVTHCIKKGWVSSAGEYVQRFEKKFSEYLKVKHAITTTSGTTALHLALASLGLGPGDEVLIPTLTMIAVPYALLYTGAKPILVDSDPEIYNIDPPKIQEFIRKRCKYNRAKKTLIDKRTDHAVKAILPVHLYGHPCQMDEIVAIAEEFNLFVVEDAAEALGALFFPKRNKEISLPVGTIGHVGCFSFYANKIITTGEGGMVVTASDVIAEKARRLKDLAHSSQKRFLHTELGFNYRMTNLQAALGLAQLEEIEKFIEIKQKIASNYRNLLSAVRGLTLPKEKEWARSVCWMYTVLVEKEFGLSRDKLMGRLREKGIETRTFFIPVHLQPLFRKDRQYKSLSFPVAEELSEKGFFLPTGLAITLDQILEVAEAIKQIQESLG